MFAPRPANVNIKKFPLFYLFFIYFIIFFNNIYLVTTLLMTILTFTWRKFPLCIAYCLHIKSIFHFVGEVTLADFCRLVDCNVCAINSS